MIQGRLIRRNTRVTERGSQAEPANAIALPSVSVEPPLEWEGRGAVGDRGGIRRLCKRTFDVIGSALAILILAPVWLTIALLIRLDSPGPVLFRQRRIGRDGEQFGMLKFRTMIRDADRRKLEVLHLNEAGDGLFKIGSDPRLTRFGRFLRSTSLDELPQLVHVLIGQMSLVGPRPLVPEEDALIQGAYRERLTMRPGITGAWQVAGASRIPMRRMVELDHAYVADWSLWGDLKLLFGTAQHVLRRRGI